MGCNFASIYQPDQYLTRSFMARHLASFTSAIVLEMQGIDCPWGRRIEPSFLAPAQPLQGQCRITITVLCYCHDNILYPHPGTQVAFLSVSKPTLLQIVHSFLDKIHGDFLDSCFTRVSSTSISPRSHLLPYIAQAVGAHVHLGVERSL